MAAEGCWRSQKTAVMQLFDPAKSFENQVLVLQMGEDLHTRCAATHLALSSSRRWPPQDSKCEGRCFNPINSMLTGCTDVLQSLFSDLDATGSTYDKNNADAAAQILFVSKTPAQGPHCRGSRSDPTKSWLLLAETGYRCLPAAYALFLRLRWGCAMLYYHSACMQLSSDMYGHQSFLCHFSAPLNVNVRDQDYVL